MGVVDGSSGVPIEEWLALFAVFPLGVVLAVVTDSSRHMSWNIIFRFFEWKTRTAGLIDSLVKMTSACVGIALTATTLVLLVLVSRSPGGVVVEGHTALTVQSLSVVVALTSASDHVHSVI